MDISELVGYVITALALFYFMGKKSGREPSHDEENHEEEQAKKLREFLRSLEDDLKEEPKPKPLPPKAPVKKAKPKKEETFSRIEDHKFQTSIEERKLKTTIGSSYVDPYISYKDPYKDKAVSADIGNAPAYQVIGKDGASRADQLLARLQSKKQMVILSEIFGPPKGL